MAEDVVELHGDRLFGDDAALVGGFATLGGRRIVFVGHQKGGDVDENIRRNFGMPHPDGYRKAMRLMRLAERLGLPIVTFVDTPGASPDAASEERGQAEAIASSIALMTRLRVPVVTVITGEGGSGGALAIAVGDVVLALENAIYSVISPEGCASILWRTPEAAQQAAVAMRLTAADQLALGVVDEVVPEPAAGAHQDPERTARSPAGGARPAPGPTGRNAIRPTSWSPAIDATARSAASSWSALPGDRRDHARASATASGSCWRPPARRVATMIRARPAPAPSRRPSFTGDGPDAAGSPPPLHEEI